MRLPIDLGCVVSVFLTGSAVAMGIQTVSVGHPGNPADQVNGQAYLGAVPYAYSIGKFEVTAGQYAAFLNAVAATDTFRLYTPSMWTRPDGCKIQRLGSSGSYTYSVASDYANRPVNFVSWGDAARFANWLHNGQPSGLQDAGTTEDGAYLLAGATSSVDLMTVARKTGSKWAIPTEDEWYKAGHYDPINGSYYQYPTRHNLIPGRDMADVAGNNANYQGTPGVPYPMDYPYYTTEVGEFENSASPCGTFDQGGNVWEWNERILPDGSSRGRRGGSFESQSFDMNKLATGGGLAPNAELAVLGFRVVQIPEPVTLAFLCPSLLLFMRRRTSA